MAAAILSDFETDTLDHLCNVPMEVQRFLPLAIRVAGAVADLHRQNIIHKDIKPANIRVNLRTDEVQVVDSGISTCAPRERHVVQNSGAIQGTLAYMSPEQTGRMNRVLDYRTDLYSLGVTYYEMLTGHLPFQADTALEWVYCHVAQMPRSPAERVPGLPQSLSDMVMRLVMKMAEDRYQSARGVQADLEACLAQWEAGRHIAPFTLGTHDVSDRLQIPQRLYGREREVAALVQAFEQMAVTGRPSLALVSGYSGIGKSSLIYELHQPVLQARGSFLVGKFDQYKRDIPYATLTTAIRGLIQQILAGSEVEVAGWKRRLEAALEGNGQLIVAAIPQIELILGQQPPVPEMPPLEAKNRFHQVFLRFLGVFASPDHPLALFLDDLQWADMASLELLEHLLTQAQTVHLLLVGAYRDNEVGPMHPLRRVLEAIRATSAPLEICLGPLDDPSLSLLVTDTLQCTAAEARPLVSLVLDKTAGNPFFIEQFLRTLDQNGWLWFDAACRQWRWDLARIRAANVTNNVVELMASQISELAPETREALKVAACIGNQFELTLLAQVMDRPPADVLNCLGAAIRNGLVLVSEGGSGGGSDDVDEQGVSLAVPGTATHMLATWLHDRVQQAAYSLIPACELPYLHRALGRALRNGAPADQLGDQLFEVTNHLNAAVALITDPDERRDLAELNLSTGRKAKDSAAFVSAITYLTAGMALLEAESWETDYDLIYGIYIELARCQWTCGQFEAAEEQITTLRNHARGLAHRANVYRLQVDLQNTRGNVAQAVQTILAACVEFCGIDFPRHPTTEALREVAEQTWQELGERSIEDLLQLPAVTDVDRQAVVAFLSTSLPLAFFTDPNLHDLICCQLVSLSLRHGNSPYSPHGYACFGAMMGRLFERWEEAYRFGQVALNLLEQFAYSPSKGLIYFVTGAFVVFWVRHIREVLPVFRKGFEAAVEYGDVNSISINSYQVLFMRFALGDPLPAVAAEAEQQAQFTRQAKHRGMHSAITGVYSCLQELRGKSFSAFPVIDGPDVDRATFESNFKKQAVAAWASTYWAYKALVKLLYGEYAEAVAAANEGEQFRVGTTGLPQNAEQCYYAALALAAHYEQATPEQQQEYLPLLLAHQERHRIWQTHGPQNFYGRYALISAEIARIQQRDPEAMQHYEEAIRSARDNGFVNSESIACERAGRFHLARGFETIGLAYLREARAGFRRWGADGKVKHLEQEFPALVERQQHVSTTTMSLRADQLDAMAAVKASQAISSQIVLSQLLETLMQTVIEQAGAQHGALLLLRQDQLWIEAEAGAPERPLDRAQPAETSDRMPSSLLSYVRRTREKVILADATQPNLFAADPYLQSARPKSILCIPLLRQGQMMGMVYLENNLATNAFTADHIVMLEMLASQAAISLENARLYEELEQRVQERTRQLRETQAELVATARQAGMAEIAVNVLHNVGNVLNSVNVSANLISQKVRTSKSAGVSRVVQLMNEHASDLGDFLTRDVKGKQLPGYLERLAEALGAEQHSLLTELEQLAGRIDHIKEIVATQQSYAGASSVIAPVQINDLVEDALQMNAAAFTRHEVTVAKEFGGVPLLPLDKHQILQIMINLISNARNAMDVMTGRPHLMTIRTTWSEGTTLKVSVEDNGEGIPAENLTRIFAHGFTTRKEGHGFGLHSCVLAAGAMGGQLRVHSDGPDKGAIFTLELPVVKREGNE